MGDIIAIMADGEHHNMEVVKINSCFLFDADIILPK